MLSAWLTGISLFGIKVPPLLIRFADSGESPAEQVLET